MMISLPRRQTKPVIEASWFSGGKEIFAEALNMLLLACRLPNR
jgi:hypothetical protein